MQNLENRIIEKQNAIIGMQLKLASLIHKIDQEKDFLKTSADLILKTSCDTLDFEQGEIYFLLDEKGNIPRQGNVNSEWRLLKAISALGFDDSYTYDIYNRSDLQKNIGPLHNAIFKGKRTQIYKNKDYIKQLETQGILRANFYEQMVEDLNGKDARNTVFPIYRPLNDGNNEVFATANFSIPKTDIKDDEPVQETLLDLAQQSINSFAAILIASSLIEDRNNALAQLRETQDQLIRAEKLAAQGTLVFGLTHDFRNLFTPVQNTNIMLAEDLGDIYDYLMKNQSALSMKDKQAFSRYIETIRRNKKNVTIIIDQTNEALKRIDEIDIGSGEKKIQDLCLEELADDSLQIYSNELRTKNISVEKNYEINPYRVLGSKYEISSIFNNLISNSIDALAQRPDPKIKITTQLKDDKVNYIHEDNGCGMSDETKKRAFDMFYTTKSVANGRQRGIGLYQVATYALGNGSNVVLESEEGKYTKFILDFLAKKL